MATTVQTILTAVGYRVIGGKTISATTDPNITECIQWLNETTLWMLGICAENKSELGRTTGTITTVDGTAAYSGFASDMYAPYEFGWVLKTNSKDKITLTTEEETLEYSPASSAEQQPDQFYVNGSNEIVLLQTPGAIYTVKIPYWQIPTAMSVVGSTVPFYGVFDNLYIESLALRMQNRDEYDLSFELKWFGFLQDKARRVIELRKGLNRGVSL